MPKTSRYIAGCLDARTALLRGRSYKPFWSELLFAFLRAFVFSHAFIMRRALNGQRLGRFCEAITGTGGSRSRLPLCLKSPRPIVTSLGSKRTSRQLTSMSVIDPKRTFLEVGACRRIDQIGPADYQGCELGQGIRPSASNAERTAARSPMRSRYEATFV
jgi:hypothetical protein